MTNQITPSGIDRAVAAAGDQTRLAADLEVTSQAVCQWVSQGYCPPKRAVEIEHRYGIPRKDLISPRLAVLLD